MRHLWRELPEACDNTLLIAERCEVLRGGRGALHAALPVPPGEDETSWFIKEVETGLQRRFPEGVPDYARKQAAFEEDVIVSKGYPGYFLVVADFINWAKRNGIRVGPGRGSGAGSMCAYAMGITDLDPVPHGLIFERSSTPSACRCPTSTSTSTSAGAVRSSATSPRSTARSASPRSSPTARSRPSRPSRTRAACSATPSPWARSSPRRCRPRSWARTSRSPASSTRAQALQRGGRLPRRPRRGPAAQEVVATALGLEGLKRQWGVHAAGVIMSSEPLIDVIPIMRRLQDGQIITQFDYPSCESLGLVKMDFLGLRNLTILDDAIENIKLNRDEDIDLDALSKDMSDCHLRPARSRRHPRGLPARRRRHALPAAAHAARQLRGHLGRPRALPTGPDGRQRAHQLRAAQERQAGLIPLDPQLEGKLQQEMIEALDPILGMTYGLVIYQEQVMEIAQSLLPATRSATPTCSAARHGQEEEGVLDAEYVPFEGMKAQGFNEASIAALWGASSRSPTTRSTRRTRRPTASSRTGRATSRPTTRPSTWPPC